MGLYIYGKNSVRNISNILNEFMNATISHETVNNILLSEKIPLVKHTFDMYSGYYMYDEEYVKIDGQWNYLMMLYDYINKEVVNFEIYPIKSNTIKKFLKESSRNIPRKIIVNDLRTDYSSIIESSDTNIKYVIFTYLNILIEKQEQKSETISKKIEKKQVQLKQTNKTEKTKKNKLTEEINTLKNHNERIEKQKKELKNIIRDTTFQETTELIIELEQEELEPVIIKLLNNLIKPNLRRITNYKTDKNIEKASSQIENSFQKAMPTYIKKIIKTTKGMKQRINLLINKQNYINQY